MRRYHGRRCRCVECDSESLIGAVVLVLLIYACSAYKCGRCPLDGFTDVLGDPLGVEPGFLLSAIVQAVVSKREMVRLATRARQSRTPAEATLKHWVWEHWELVLRYRLTPFIDRTNRGQPTGHALVRALFLGKIDYDYIRVLPQAVEHDLFPVARDVAGPHRGTVLKPSERAGFHGGELKQPEIL